MHCIASNLPSIDQLSDVRYHPRSIFPVVGSLAVALIFDRTIVSSYEAPANYRCSLISLSESEVLNRRGIRAQFVTLGQ